MIKECNFKIRDEEFKRRKELETEKKDKNKDEQEHQGKVSKRSRNKEQEDKQNQSHKEGNNQKQAYQQREQEWQVQKRRNNKQQKDKVQKTIWRPTSPQNRRTKEQQQHVQQQPGTPNISSHNSFTNLNMQEKQNIEGDGPTSNRGTPNQGIQHKHTRNTGIDSAPPIPTDPSSSSFVYNVEVKGGMDGGSPEKHTNLQEGVSKGGNLTHVLHEGTHFDHSPNYRASATTKNQKHMTESQQAQQQKKPEAHHIVSTRNDKEQQQGKEIIGDIRTKEKWKTI
ncbi:hypothetical protein R3W88_033323 [Solanum pinnatisectum]|uniref:Uncharacterized protein n=1 Tax=Solanum pinnatisectum TaxID=50273 RepID=A0AAV9K1Q3_9SOLN|nr:hypothetical protein R3W88_033323 [Solanum pinnatisectum]